MKRAVTMWLAALLALSLTACGGGASGGGDATASSSAEGGESLSFSTQESQDSAPGEPGAEAEEASPQAGQNAKLIRRAELEIQTEAFDAAAASLEALVAEAGGYFQSAQVEGGSLRDQNAARYGNYVIRLPEENFSAFLDQSGTLGYVVRRSESSENVSQAYYDTETRLAAQRTKQERLLALLAQADTMESIIELENALSETEYEIQSLTTDLEHYDDLIDYATVDLYLATGGADGRRPVRQRGGTGPGGPGPAGVAVLPPVPGDRGAGSCRGRTVLLAAGAPGPERRPSGGEAAVRPRRRKWSEEGRGFCRAPGKSD